MAQNRSTSTVPTTRSAGAIILSAVIGALALAVLTSPTRALEIPDSKLAERLAAVESAYRAGDLHAARGILFEVTQWAHLIRDGRSTSLDPARNDADAERIYQRVLDTVARTFGARERAAWDPAVGLAGLYREQRRYADAESLLLRALAIADAERDPHAKEGDRARTLRELGILYEAQGRLADAAAQYGRAADAWDRVPRGKHARDDMLARQADLLRRTGHEAAAKAAESRMAPPYRPEPDPVRDAWEGAHRALNEGRYADAERLFTQTLRGAESAGSQDAIRSARMGLLNVYIAQQRLREAEAMCRTLGIVSPRCTTPSR